MFDWKLARPSMYGGDAVSREVLLSTAPEL